MAVEEEDKKLAVDGWDVKFKIYQTFVYSFKFISLAASFLGKTRCFEKAAEEGEISPRQKDVKIIQDIEICEMAWWHDSKW
jgi:hypothetical protein